jgi:uncharacterized damage-inducible protein DinB
MAEPVQDYIQRLLGYTGSKDSLKLLATAPARIAKVVKGKSRAQLAKRPAPGKWSVGEILAHLADAEVAIGWRLRQILASDGVALSAYDQDAWANTFHYAKRDPRNSMAAYASARAANVLLLKAVPRKLWDNAGMHSERGRETVAHMMKLAAGHDLNHQQQIERILKGRR